MPAGGWVHYGLTSSDVVDTALSLVLTESVDLLLTAAVELRGVLATRAIEFGDTPCMGRTHGIHAEPTTFGAKLALFALAVDRDIERLRRARITIAVGKLSGAVGTSWKRLPATRCARIPAYIEWWLTWKNPFPVSFAARPCAEDTMHTMLREKGAGTGKRASTT